MGGGEERRDWEKEEGKGGIEVQALLESNLLWSPLGGSVECSLNNEGRHQFEGEGGRIHLLVYPGWGIG